MASYEAQIVELTNKKAKALQEEDYLFADQCKREIEELKAKAAAEPGDTVAAQQALTAAEAKLAELVALKAQKLRDEDFLGAHEVKAKIQEQEKEVQTLQNKLQVAARKSTAVAEGVADSDIFGSDWVPSADSTKVMLRDSGTPALGLPRENFNLLYPYQRVGVSWLGHKYASSKGCILADEMGLGKTVQVCSTLKMARAVGATHVLIMVPVTLADQWEKEAKLWCPGWPVYHMRGSANQKMKAIKRVMKPEGGILIGSYNSVAGGILEQLSEVRIEEYDESQRTRGRKPSYRGAKRRKLDDGRLDDGDDDEDDAVDDAPQVAEQGPNQPHANGTTRPWDIIVADEAHRMKNISTLLGKSVRQLKCTCRILLTGTPVQNALQDLWSLFDFAEPGLLGNHATFVKNFSDPIDRGSLRGASPYDVMLKNHLSQQLRGLIEPYLLRRTKAEVGLMANQDVEIADAVEEHDEAALAALPPKLETIVWLEPSQDQAQIYKKVLEKSEVVKAAVAKMKLGVEVFRGIGLCKRLCNHPALCVPLKAGETWREFLKEAMAGTLPEEISEEGSDSPATPTQDPEEDNARAGAAAERMLKALKRTAQDLVRQSTKLQFMEWFVPALAARGHRMLIFSQSTKMLDLIQICVLRPKGLRCLRIDGATDAPTRHEKVEKFQNQIDRFSVMLCSTQVGGVGLNLTKADRVILVDPAWNPATDAQAVDRAFRIGQEKEVRVYRLIQSGLMEDKMFRLQVFKMGLCKTALEANQQNTYFTGREIKALFEWVEPTEGETRKLLDQAHGKDGEGDDSAKNAAEDLGFVKPEDVKVHPIIDTSNFNLLFSHLAPSEDVQMDDVCERQVEEARQNLGAADEKAAHFTNLRIEAEKARDDAEAAAQAAVTGVSEAVTNRAKADEILKVKRKELSESRKTEAAARCQLESTSRALERAKEHSARAKADSARAQELVEVSERADKLATKAAENAEDAVPKSIADASDAIAVVDESGKAVGDGVVDADRSKYKAAEKKLDKAKKALDDCGLRRVEYEHAEQEFNKLEIEKAEADAKLIDAEHTQQGVKVCQETVRRAKIDVSKAETAKDRAENKLEAAQEATKEAIAHLLEASEAFAGSFVATANSSKGMAKQAQVTTRGIFKSVRSAWTTALKLQLEQLDSTNRLRKAQQKLRECSSKDLIAEREIEVCEATHKEAVLEEEARRAEFQEREHEARAAEEAAFEAEKAEIEAKSEKERTRNEFAIAKEKVKPAKQAEKDAGRGRDEIMASTSKVEKKHEMMEAKMSSALETLKGEAYQANQVNAAFEKAAKSREKRKEQETNEEAQLTEA